MFVKHLLRTTPNPTYILSSYVVSIGNCPTVFRGGSANQFLHLENSTYVFLLSWDPVPLCFFSTPFTSSKRCSFSVLENAHPMFHPRELDRLLKKCWNEKIWHDMDLFDGERKATRHILQGLCTYGNFFLNAVSWVLHVAVLFWPFRSQLKYALPRKASLTA